MSDTSLLSAGKKRLLLLGFSLFLGLGLGEVALRLLWHNPYRNESPDHVVKIQIHHPRSDFLIDRRAIDTEQPTVRMRTNARSYLIPSSQHPDPDYSVAFLGGSTTECAAVQESERFPAVVSELLGQAGLKVNTLNAGRSGNTAHDSLLNLQLHVARDEPDMAVLLHAVNDVGVLARDGDYWSRVGHPVSWKDQLRWTLQSASGAFYLAAITRYVATHQGIQAEDSAAMAEKNEPARAGLPEEQFRARLAAFVHLCRDFGITPVLMTQPMSASRNAMTPEWSDLGNQDRFNAIIREIGQREQVPVIDLVNFLQESVEGWNEPMNIFYDGLHVTDKGSRVLGEHIAASLRPLIQAELKASDAPTP
jgi:lysophospholipase L1-like esterase